MLHSANIFPDGCKEVRAVTHEQTADALTVDERLMRWGRSDYALNRLAFWIQSEWPGGDGLRQYVIDPIYYRAETTFDAQW